MKIALNRFQKFTYLLSLTLLATALLPSQATAAGKKRPSGTANDKIKPKFNSACASCHGKDGAGTALSKSMQAPDLRSEQVQKHGDAELAQVIAEGKGDMPSFKRSFNENQIHALVQYVRQLPAKKEPAQK